MMRGSSDAMLGGGLCWNDPCMLGNHCWGGFILSGPWRRFVSQGSDKSSNFSHEFLEECPPKCLPKWSLHQRVHQFNDSIPPTWFSQVQRTRSHSEEAFTRSFRCEPKGLPSKSGLGPPARCPFSPPFLVGRVPLQ